MSDLRLDKDLAAVLALGDDAPSWLLLSVDRPHSSGVYIDMSLRLHAVAYAGMPSASQQEKTRRADEDGPDQQGIRISSLSGETIADIDKCAATLHGIKETIQQLAGIPVAQQRLLIGDIELTDDSILSDHSDEHFLEITLVRDATGQRKELCCEARRCFFDPPSRPGRRSDPVPGYVLWRSCVATETSWQLAKAAPSRASFRLKTMMRSFASSVQTKVEEKLRLQSPIIAISDECEELSDLEEFVFRSAESID